MRERRRRGAGRHRRRAHRRGGADPRAPGRAIAVMTDPALPSGTDRVAAVAAARGWSDDTIVVNVQGDEPFLPPALIDQVAALLERDAAAGIATLATPIGVARGVPGPERRQGRDCGRRCRAVFQPGADPVDARRRRRQGLPASANSATRCATSASTRTGSACCGASRAWRRPASSCARSSSSSGRMQNGIRIVVGTCVEAPGPGVDTEQDLEQRGPARRAAPAAQEAAMNQVLHGRVRRHAHAVEAGRLPRRGAVRRALVRADVLLAHARQARSCRRCSGS